MSQILIISDTHFLREHDLEEFFNTVKGYDAIIHCGDIFLGFDPKTFHAPKPLYICPVSYTHLDVYKRQTIRI